MQLHEGTFLQYTSRPQHIWTLKATVRLQAVYLKISSTLRNAGLNTTQCWVKRGQTQRLGCFDPEVGLNI